MKKLSVLLVVVLASVSMASAQGWGAGGRIGSGLQAVGQRYFWNGNYLEGRLGMGWLYQGGIAADFSVMHVWNVSNMDWTYEGNWFFDAGAGLAVGGYRHYSFFGVQGMARLGYEFEDAPVRLSFDWSPSLGPGVSYVYFEDSPGRRESVSDFNARGFANFGFSFVYRF